jgi:hypothetical protein
MHSMLRLPILSALYLALGTSTFADLSISLSPSAPSFTEGSSGYIDVRISSNASDALDGFSANFLLSGAGLEFANPQAESHLTNEGYVFFNRSNSVVSSLPSTAVNSAMSMNVSDLSDDGVGGPNPFTVGGVGSESLLARLNLHALSAGSYTLNLLNNSSFNDVGFNNFAFNTPSLNITVTAVPEPSSIGGAAALALGGFLIRRKRGTQSKSPRCLSNRITPKLHPVAPRLRSRGLYVR